LKVYAVESHNVGSGTNRHFQDTIVISIRQNRPPAVKNLDQPRLTAEVLNELDSRMALEPAVLFRLMRVQIVYYLADFFGDGLCLDELQQIIRAAGF